MLSELIRKLVPASDTVSVSEISVIIIECLCDIILIAERLAVTGKYDLVIDTHFLGQDFL